MSMVPGASLPSNGTVSRWTGEATGCNCESRALANTGAVPALRERPTHTAARIRLRRMIPLVETIDNFIGRTPPPVLRLDSAQCHNYGDTTYAMHCAQPEPRIGQLR